MVVQMFGKASYKPKLGKKLRLELKLVENRTCNRQVMCGQSPVSVLPKFLPAAMCRVKRAKIAQDSCQIENEIKTYAANLFFISLCLFVFYYFYLLALYFRIQWEGGRLRYGIKRYKLLCTKQISNKEIGMGCNSIVRSCQRLQIVILSSVATSGVIGSGGSLG